MKRIVALLFFVMFLIGTDTFLVAPLLPVLSHVYHLPPALSGWMVSAYAFGYALFALIVGPISDQLDRKKLLVCGLLAFALSTFLCAFAPNFLTMVLLRALAGISAAIAAPQVWAGIPQLIEAKDIVRTFGLVTGGLSVAQMVGVPLGSYLAAFSWHAPFLAVGMGAGLLTVFLIRYLPALPAKRAKTPVHFLSTYGVLFGQRRIRLYFTGYFFFQLAFYTAFSFIGLWFAAAFSLSLAKIGTVMIVLGAGNFAGSFWGSHLFSRFGVHRAIGLLLLGIACLYAALAVTSSLPLAVGLLILIFFAGGCAFPLLMSLLQSLAPQARGTISALTNAMMYMGAMCAGVIGGVLFGHSYNLFLWIGLFSTLSNIMALFLDQRAGLFHNVEAEQRT
ncbi:MAG: MFS transporter [Sporolactobacillus sp.]